MTVSTTVPDGHRRRLFATRAMFLIVGLGMACWAPLVPVVKARLGISEGALGLLILMLGLGALCAMPIAGALAARFGLRRAMIWPAVIAFAVFPILLITTNFWVAAVALAVFGGSLSIADVAMNMQAVIVEEEGGTPRMSAFHGMWSVGGLLGAPAIGAALWLGLSPLAAAAIVITVALVGLFLISDGLIPRTAEDDDKPLFVRPRGEIIWLGVICALAFLAEFSVLDWSAVYLTGTLGTGVAASSLAYTGFSLSMTVMRFAGDRFRVLLGDGGVLLSGGLLAVLAFGLITTAGGALQAVLGFILLGFGIANVVPILFSVAGRSKVMPAHLALPAVVMMGQVGALGGPAAIGAIAEMTSLRFAFALLALTGVVIAASFRLAHKGA